MEAILAIADHGVVLVPAIVLITAALAFYSAGVWSERRVGRLRWRHAALFGAGLVLGLLTKDHLPSYHRLLAQHHAIASHWGRFVGHWTAEENRHSIALRDQAMAKGEVVRQNNR